MIINHAITTTGLIKGQADLTAAIVAMKGASKAWHKLTHQVAASAAVHAHLTGDIRPMAAALKAMPAGAKTNSMRQYFLNFAPVKWSAVAKKFKFDATRQKKELLEGQDNDLLSALLAKHWSECGPVDKADSFKPYDLQAKLLNIIKAANEALDGPDKDKQTLKGTDVNALAELVRKLYPEGKAA